MSTYQMISSFSESAVVQITNTLECGPATSPSLPDIESWDVIRCNFIQLFVKKLTSTA